jgi:hypothetical protein
MQLLITTLLHEVFPNETITFEHDYKEVNGLSAECVPVGVIDSFVPELNNDKVFYLIQIKNIFMLLRVCEAAKSADYAKFAVIHKTSITSNVRDVKNTYYWWKNSLSAVKPDTPINITITAQVITTVNLAENETLEDFKNRYVDIYLHGPGEDGCCNKRDVGANKWTITTDNEDIPLIVSRDMFLALVNTVKNTTDLENVYDDENNKSFSWAEIDAVLRQ